MEINISPLLDLDCFNLSHSAAEGGQDAGRNTWSASLVQAKETPLLDSEEKLEAMREFAKDSGGWSEEEISVWPPEELNALFLQFIAGDVREAGADSLEDMDWAEYEERAEAGRCSGRIFSSADEQVFYYLGS